jgi:hypothetical protein
MDIVKAPPDFDAFVTAMFLMWARAPRNPNPELDGSFNLGEIGSDATKNWTRATPYSPTEIRAEKP